jgi:iron complex outermembrane recepter protein
MKKIALIGCLAHFTFLLVAQSDSLNNNFLQEVLVKSNWADDKTPMTYKNLTKKQLNQQDMGQDMPYLLQFTPSVVVSSDAGAGIGYTGIRIRGTDPTRINVTLNGIPYNDSESQSVYWVNMYDIVGSTEKVQIQRGVGTSTNGAGAFGASINLNTNTLQTNSFGEMLLGAGSFNTYRQSLRWGSGLINQRWSIEGRLSNADSEGYVDRASSRLRSGDIAISYLLPRASFRLNAIAGKEITYQSWYGLPIQLLETKRTFNVAGTEKQDVPYDNQVDNYSQKHLQFFYNQQLTKNLSSSIALHWTGGKGYYEEYKAAQSWGSYLPNDTSAALSDLVRRRWLDNHFVGTVYGLKWEKERYNITVGGGYNVYFGEHFGEIIWANQPPADLPKDFRWYDNDARKSDFNTYVKAHFNITNKFSAFGDAQIRQVTYTFVGKDRNANALDQTANLTFFNPKFGFTYLFNKQFSAYTSFAVAQREPNRNDFTNSSLESRPQHEQLYNTELGIRRVRDHFNFGANLYYMAYRNELVLTGKINDVGEYTRVNVPKSYRSGIEIDANFLINSKLQIGGNLTLSRNKVKQFTEYIDDWTTGEQITVTHRNTDIAFSPNVISAAMLHYSFWQRKKSKMSFRYNLKAVGKQYLDNTQDDIASLPAYSQSDIMLFWEIQPKHFSTIELALQCNNILNNQVISNGWTYRYLPGFDAANSDNYTIKGRDLGIYNQIGLYPQAMRNVLVSLRAKF